MNADLMERITPLWDDDLFMDSLAAAETEQEVLGLFAQKGVPISPEDMKEFKALAERQDELSEKELEHISGGTVIRTGKLERIERLLRRKNSAWLILKAWRMRRA